jgi:glucose/arabinose dehydrogenase
VHGIAIHDDKMYLAIIHAIYIADMRKDGTLGKLQTLVDDLPNGGQHANRTLGFGPDGMLYVSVGSLCDTCSETDPKNATILQVDPNSGQETIFASGLRNTLGFAWHPKTKEMWGMDLGIDFLGDNKPGEELNHLVKGAMYGWPYAYGNRQPNTEIKASSGESIAKMVKQSKPAALLYTAHAAPMQMAFYTGSQFPAAYRDDAFVAMHGSWNRRPPSGYEIIRIKFNDAGQPQAFAPFVTGFLTRQKGGTYAEFGRPTGLAIAKDGSLLVGDDTHGVIYRISYQGNSQ